MDMLRTTVENKKLTVYLSGSLDGTNAAEIGRRLDLLCGGGEVTSVLFDCDGLTYCSSVGLRMILHIKKMLKDTVIDNAHTEFYETLELTGFTDMMEVHRAYRTLSVGGCQLMGQGANSFVYRVDSDTAVKVYKNENALEDIRREQELSRKAFVAGLPTAIPYDIVRVAGGGYGSVFELLNSQNLAQLLISGEKSLDEVASLCADLLKLIHAKTDESCILPDIKAKAFGKIAFLRKYLPFEVYQKLVSLIESLPTDLHILHGDFNPKNIILQNGECLLIDMDTLGHGHPIFELMALYNVYVGFGALDRDYMEKFTGIPYAMGVELWRKILALYLDTDEEERLQAVETKARVLGLAKIMRREIRRGGFAAEDKRKLIEYCASELSQWLPKIDTLEF
ncbi:MAG: phosphotransferase [Clostridia bacterium]|nr:phosphotransferase [Clostridia bacterium]